MALSLDNRYNSSAPVVTGVWSCLVDYVASSDGAWTCFSVVDHALAYVQWFRAPSPVLREISSKIAILGSALSVPACLGAGCQVGKALLALKWGSVCHRSVDFLYELTDLPDLLHRVQWITLTHAKERWVQTVYDLTVLCSEGIDLMDTTPVIWQLRWIATVKSAASIASSCLSLMGGSSLILHLNALWLVMKITAHFYKKIVVESV